MRAEPFTKLAGRMCESSQSPRRLKEGGGSGIKPDKTLYQDMMSLSPHHARREVDAEATGLGMDSKARVSLLVKLWTGSTETDGSVYPNLGAFEIRR